MLTLLVIVLILSTTCVIFQDKVADFLLKYIFTEKRLKRIDGFLSGKELRKEAQEIDFVLNASASELKGRFQNICKKYGKRYQKKIQRPPYMQLLPIAVQDFFEKYDYLVIARHKILDIEPISKRLAFFLLITRFLVRQAILDASNTTFFTKSRKEAILCA